MASGTKEHLEASNCRIVQSGTQLLGGSMASHCNSFHCSAENETVWMFCAVKAVIRQVGKIF